MKRKLKRMLGIIGILCFMIPLAACGGLGNSDNEIVLWNPFVGADSENWQRMIDEFNATEPEYTIRNVSMEQDAMYTNISTVYPTGTGIPDLMVVHAERIQQFVQNDMLMSLNDLLADFPGITAENYVESAWNIGEINGSRYGVPLDIHTWVMYYNRELLEKYGPDVLDDGIITFDEIREIGERAAQDDVATLGLTWMIPNFLSLYSQMGGSITEDGINPTLYNDTAVRTLEMLKELYEDGFTNENGEDASQLFQTGQLIFIPEGIWYANTANQIEDFEWGMTHSPQYSTENLVNWSSSHQFVMFNSEERTEEKEVVIMEFLDWVRENSIEWARAGQNPAALDILESDEFQEMPQAFLLKTEEGQKSLEIFEYLYNGFATQEINRIGHDVVFGNIDVREALSSAQRAVEDQIAHGGNNQ